LNDYKTSPSSAVKKNIDAALDKKDAEKYKKKFLVWKRSAIFLLLLLSGFALYESGLIKKGKRNYITEKSTTNTQNISTDKAKETNKNTIPHSSAENKTSLQPAIQTNTINAQQEQKDIITTAESFLITSNRNSNHKKNSLAPIIPIQIENNEDVAPTNDNYSPTTIPEIEILSKRIISAIITERSTKDFSLLSPPFISNAMPLIAINSSEKKKSNSFKPFWEITPFTSYEKAGYRLDSDLPNIINSIKHNEAHEPSFTAGLFISYQFAKNWGLQSGLLYSNTQIGISPQKMYAFQNGNEVAYKFISSSGYAYIKPAFGAPPAVGDSLSTTEAKHNLQFVSIPLSINYKIGKNKFSISPGAGIEANFLTAAKLETEIKDASNLETVTLTKLNGAKPFYLSVTASTALQYEINKKISLVVRPSYRLALSTITKNNVVQTFPRSFGIGAGLSIKF
jgi:hypothetical protein